MNIEMIEPAETLEPTTAIVQTPEVRAVVALNASKTETDLRALVEKAKAITQVNSPDGREECHGQLMVLVKSRTAITKLAKAVRDDATKFSKAVIAEQDRLLAITAAEEARLQTLRDDWDKKVAAEKEAKAAAERARVLAITTRIAEIKGFATLAAQCRTSARIQELMDKLAAVELTGFEEYEQDAKDAHAATLEAMTAAHAAKKADEDERARVLAEQQAEAERQRLQAEELARQRAELEAERAKLQAQAEAQAAEAERLAIAAVMLSTALDEPEPTPQEAQELERSDLKSDLSRAVEPIPTPTLTDEQQQAIEDAIDAAPGDVLTLATNVVTLPRKTTRPSDADLIGTLAMSYSVHESTVVSWLLDMDLNAASAALLAEFNTPKEKA